jgi:hypothetical protein
MSKPIIPTSTIRASSEQEARRAAKASEAYRTSEVTAEPLKEDSTLHRQLQALSQRRHDKLEGERVKMLESELLFHQDVIDTLAALTSRPLEPVLRREIKSRLREATAVLMLSDVHCEEPVRLGETPYPNQYNLEIAERSIARFFAGAEWLIKFHRHAFQLRDIVLWLGGDLMSGHIHEELKENTAMPPIETLLWLRSRLVAGIDRLLEDTKIERLVIPCSYGNHGRTTQKAYRSLGASHSYEWLLYQWIASTYEHNPRVQILADRSAHQYVRVYDWDLHFHHGDETNYNGGIGGITIPLNKAAAQWDKANRCDYHHFGHWHQYIDTGNIVVNGSMIGFNAYAMSIKASPEPPQQAFYLLDSKRGKTCRSPIWVRDSKDLPTVTRAA